MTTRREDLEEEDKCSSANKFLKRWEKKTSLPVLQKPTRLIYKSRQCSLPVSGKNSNRVKATSAVS